MFAPPGVFVGALGLWLTEPPLLGRVEPLPVVPPDWPVAKAVAVLKTRTAAAVPLKMKVFMLVVSVEIELASPNVLGELIGTNVGFR